MDRQEKLRLSADSVYCHCFKQGLFARFYEQSLYWFIHVVKPLKPMRERVKGGKPVLYGGLPVSSLEVLLKQGMSPQAEVTEYGWRWPYAAQKEPVNMVALAEWRQAALAETEKIKMATCHGRNIFSEILSFNLAGHTPLQAMTAIAEWQDFLRNREGAG